MKKLIMLLFLAMAIAGCTTPQKTSVDIPQVNFAERAKQAFDGGDYAKAAEDYQRWLAEHPEDSEALFDLGRCYRQLKKYNEALDIFAKAIAANPKDLRSQVYHCEVLMALGRQKQVQPALKKAIDDPAFQRLGVYEKFMALYIDGQLKNSQGIYEGHEQALISLEEALRIFDLHPHVFRNYGSAHINRFAIYQMAVAHHVLGNNVQAAAEMEKYIALTKQAGIEVSSKDYKSLALALYLSDRLEKCRTILPQMTPEDRKALAELFADNFFLPK